MPGAAYEVEGTLELAGDDCDAPALVGEDGMPVTATCVLVAGADGTGSAEIAYALDASGLAGQSVRVRELLTRDGAAVAVATGDVVRIPRVSVITTDAATGTHECDARVGGVTVSLDVTLANLPDVSNLVASCTLLDASTGLPVVGADGREATARTAVSGGIRQTTARLSVDVDATKLEGASLVAIARVGSAGRTVASTELDWDDHARVSVPRVTATLTDAASGSSVATLGACVPLIACVEVEGIERDATHAVTLEIVVAETAEPVRDALGAPVRSVVTLEAQGTSASAQAVLPLDTTACQGRPVAVHATLAQADAVTGASDVAEPEARVRVAAATVELGTDRLGTPVATISWSGLEPGDYVARVLDGTGDGPATEQPLTVESDEGTAQLPIAGITTGDGQAEQTISVEILHDGRVVALATEGEGVPAAEAVASRTITTRENLRRIVPVVDGRWLLARIAYGVLLAIVATGALALRGMRVRERPSDGV